MRTMLAAGLMLTVTACAGISPEDRAARDELAERNRPVASASESPSPEPTPTPTPTKRRTKSPAPAPEQTLTSAEADFIYVQAVRAQVSIGSTSDEELADLGRQICRTLRGGRDPEGYARAMIANGVTPAHAGAFLGAAPPAYCTDQEARVMRFLRSS